MMFAGALTARFVSGMSRNRVNVVLLPVVRGGSRMKCYSAWWFGLNCLPCYESRIYFVLTKQEVWSVLRAGLLLYELSDFLGISLPFTILVNFRSYYAICLLRLGFSFLNLNSIPFFLFETWSNYLLDMLITLILFVVLMVLFGLRGNWRCWPLSILLIWLRFLMNIRLEFSIRLVYSLLLQITFFLLYRVICHGLDYWEWCTYTIWVNMPAFILLTDLPRLAPWIVWSH